MVHDGGVAGPELESADVTFSLDRYRDNEIPEHILAFGDERKGFWHAHDKVGLAELPTLDERRRLGPRRSVALERAAVDPITNRRDLFRRKTPLARKFPVALLGKPWRHDASFDRACNLRRLFPSVFVGQEAKRCRLTRAVAAHTVSKQDRRDVAGPGPRRLTAVRHGEEHSEHSRTHGSASSLAGASAANLR